MTHALSGGSITSWSTPRQVRASAQEQFFLGMSAAPNGRVNLGYYDRSCDPAVTLNCLTLSSTFDGGATWTDTALTTRGFGGDKYQACLAFVEQPDCGTFFLGDYIASRMHQP